MTRGEFRLVAGATAAGESSPAPVEAAVLRHLRRVGFDGAPATVPAPRHGGRDGPPPVEPSPPHPSHAHPSPMEASSVEALPVEVGAERALRAMARLLRRFHDAVASFPGPHSRLPYGLGGVAPRDVVFVGGLPRRLARLPALEPMPRVADVALTLLHWAPVRDPGTRPAAQRVLDPGPRLAGFCDAYGLGAQPRRAVLPVIREHLRVSGDDPALAWLDTYWEQLDAHLH